MGGTPECRILPFLLRRVAHEVVGESSDEVGYASPR